MRISAWSSDVCSSDLRPDRPHLPARRPLVRARLQIQPPARLRPRAAGRGDGAQRVRPAGADLHPGPAPLAALPPGRRVRLRPRLRRRPLRVLPARTNVVKGQRLSVRVDLGVPRIIKKKTHTIHISKITTLNTQIT